MGVQHIYSGLIPGYTTVANYLSQLSLYISIPIVCLVAFFIVIANNVFYQLVILPMVPNRVPLVFHFVPWVGSSISYGQKPFEFFEKNQRKYGDHFSFILCGMTVTVCLGRNGNNFVFNSHSAYTSAEDAYRHVTTPVFGEGVVYDCPSHKFMEQKKFAKAALTRDRFRSYVPKIAKEVEDYIANSSHFKDGSNNVKSGTVDLLMANPEITMFTASRTLLGDECRELFDQQTENFYSGLIRGCQPLNLVFPYLPLPYYWARDKAHREVSAQFMSVMSKRRESNDIHDRDLIGTLMNNCTYKDGVKMTDQQIANLCIAFMIAGHHTSASVAAWVLLHLGNRPEMIEALYKEQEKVLGRDSGGNLHPLTYDALQEMTLINSIIREALRLNTPVHSLLRKVKRDFPIPATDFIVPKGHYVMASPGMTHISEEYFKNPTEFNPYRWEVIGTEDNEAKPDQKIEDISGEIGKGTNLSYLPFGSGRHRCVGEQFAYVQIGTIISTFVRELDWNLPDGKGLPQVDFGSPLAVLPKGPANIVWTMRE